MNYHPKSILIKRPGKQQKEHRILLGLVDYYIQTGKPVGSNTLKEAGFEDLSSATIRNYFASLEEQGFLVQSHASGGRLPTDAAYRIYADYYLALREHLEEHPFKNLSSFDSREVSLYLQVSAETLSQESKYAVFLSAPRFDQDYIIDIKLLLLDAQRCLCVIMTDFGLIDTEVVYLTKKLSLFSIKRIETYFHARLTGLGEIENLEVAEKEIAQKIYKEIFLRYIVGYSNFTDEDIYRTGFSHLLNYPDLQETGALANSLSLFENVRDMRRLLKECKSLNQIKFWVGDDLTSDSQTNSNCSVICIPYYINQNPVGAVGILGPSRMPYRKLFALMRLYSDSVSQVLTQMIYKFKLHFREPETEKCYPKKSSPTLLDDRQLILLEDKRT